MFNGSGLSCEFGGRDHADPRMGQEQDPGGLGEEPGQFAFEELDLLGFSLPVDEECLPDAGHDVSHGIAGDGVGGPGEQAFDRAGLEGTAFLFEPAGDSGDSGVEQGLMGAAMCGDELQGHESDGMVPEVRVGKERAVPREAAFKIVADLALEPGAFVDEITSMPGEELQGQVAWCPGLAEQSEAIDGSAEDGDEIMVIGFDIAMFGLAIVAGGKGVYKPGVEACIAEGSPDDLVIGCGHLDTDDGVLESVLFDRFAKCVDGHAEVVASMFDGSGRDEDAAIEIGQHPLGAVFGTIDADDSEVFGAGLLDAGLNDPGRLTEDGLGQGLGEWCGTAFAVFACGNHDNCLSVKKCSSNISHNRS